MNPTVKSDKTAPQRSVALTEAWNCFAQYDYNAGLTQRRFFLLRKMILGFGLAAATLAVLHSVTDPQMLLLGILPLKEWLHYAVVITPIVVSVLAAGAVKFDRGAASVMLRSSSEAIKREIFRYRARVEEYHSTGEGEEIPEVKLAQKIENINTRLMNSPAGQGSLQPVNDEGLLDRSVAAGDDRYSWLTPETYLRWRLEDQLNYYRGKVRKLDRLHQILQWTIYGLGGVGTLLAAVQQEIWVAVTSAGAGVVAAYLEIKSVEPTIASYNQAASDLNNTRIWWSALPASQKTQHARFEQLVKNTETIIQTENATWVQEMQEALRQLYSEGQPAEGEGFAEAPGVEPIAQPVEQPAAGEMPDAPLPEETNYPQER